MAVPDEPKQMWYMTWQEYERYTKRLAINIAKSGKEYDYVSGIPRGGLVPAVHLSHLLDVPFRAQWNDVPKQSRVLLVDDISDTGTTLNGQWKVYEHDTATICYKKDTKHIPTFVGRIQPYPDYVWVVFPWEE